MSWMPNDLVTDKDLEGYERTLLTQFGATDWQARRKKALEDWLFPLLEATGFDPQRFRTRFVPQSVMGYTSSAYSDKGTAATTVDGLDLAAILAASTDYLYIGSSVPFRGVSIRMADAVSSATGTASWTVWADAWKRPDDLVDQTLVGAKAFGRGGAVTWTMPEQVVARSVNSVGPYYWARVSASAAPTSALAGPLLVIRRSRLCAAVTLRTLALIFREAPTGQEGPWDAKAQWYEQEAERAWLRVVDHIGGEFDSDQSDAISSTESQQTAAAVSGGGWQWERG